MILGTIGAYSAGQGVTLTIDGEETPTQKDYKFLSSYTPAAGDRVLIEEIADSYVVLGKLADTASEGGGGGDISNLSLSYNAAANPSANDAMYLKNGSTNLSYARIDSVRKALSVKNYGSVNYIWFRFSGDVLQWAAANDQSYPLTWHNLASS